MLTISMDKIITMSKELGRGMTAMSDHKYKDLERILDGETEIKVNYVFGQKKRRMNQLAKLGFNKKETIFYNDHALYGAISEIWIRKENVQ